MTWWDFEARTGQHGKELATYQIVCGFCNEQGIFWCIVFGASE